MAAHDDQADIREQIRRVLTSGLSSLQDAARVLDGAHDELLTATGEGQLSDQDEYTFFAGWAAGVTARSFRAITESLAEALPAQFPASVARERVQQAEQPGEDDALAYLQRLQGITLDFVAIYQGLYLRLLDEHAPGTDHDD